MKIKKQYYKYKQKIVEVQKTHYIRDWDCDVEDFQQLTAQVS
ncbi:hypothetical protein [Lysinibacillus sphaericus]|nr:hypothetical protein [Lysinibacillus sp. SDF0037]